MVGLWWSACHVPCSDRLRSLGSELHLPVQLADDLQVVHQIFEELTFLSNHFLVEESPKGRLAAVNHDDAGDEALVPGALRHHVVEIGGCGACEQIELRGLDLDGGVATTTGLGERVAVVKGREAVHEVVLPLGKQDAKFVTADQEGVERDDGGDFARTDEAAFSGVEFVQQGRAGYGRGGEVVVGKLGPEAKGLGREDGFPDAWRGNENSVKIGVKVGPVGPDPGLPLKGASDDGDGCPSAEEGWGREAVRVLEKAFVPCAEPSYR